MKKLKSQNKQIQSSIKYAERIQTAILPSSSYILDLFSSHFVFYQAKDVVSEDFYLYYSKQRITLYKRR